MCLSTLTKIDQIIATYHFICMSDHKKCEKTNIKMHWSNGECQVTCCKWNVIGMKNCVSLARMKMK
jgi:hypothetical protein